MRCLLTSLVYGMCFASAAHAAPIQVNHLDVGLAGSTLEADYPDGTEIEIEYGGLNLSGMFEMDNGLLLRISSLGGEAEDVAINGTEFNVDSDLHVLRFGLGLIGGEELRYYGSLEYGRTRLDVQGGDSSTEEGIILSGGLRDSGEHPFLWEVELGLVSLGDLGGSVFQFGLGYRFNPTFALLFGGQGYALTDDEDDSDLTYSAGTLGARFHF